MDWPFTAEMRSPTFSFPHWSAGLPSITRPILWGITRKSRTGTATQLIFMSDKYHPDPELPQTSQRPLLLQRAALLAQEKLASKKETFTQSEWKHQGLTAWPCHIQGVVPKGKHGKEMGHICKGMSKATCPRSSLKQFVLPLSVLFSISRIDPGALCGLRQLWTSSLTESLEIWMHGLSLPPCNQKLSLKYTSKGNQTSARHWLSNLVSTFSSDPQHTQAAQQDVLDHLCTDQFPIPALRDELAPVIIVLNFS